MQESVRLYTAFGVEYVCIRYRKQFAPGTYWVLYARKGSGRVLLDAYATWHQLCRAHPLAKDAKQV